MTNVTETPAPQPFSFTLRVRDWHRGRTGSLLLTEAGTQCCVGQLAEQCGVPREKLLGKGAVFALDIDDLPPALHWTVLSEPSRIGLSLNDKTNSHEVLTIYRENDDPTTSDEQKIAELTKLFAKVGIEMTVDRESTTRDVE